MSELITNNLGNNNTIDQVSIETKIDYEQILDFFYVNVNKIEKFLTKKDNYSSSSYEDTSNTSIYLVF